MNKTKKLLQNLGPNVENANIQRIIDKEGDLHHFYNHIVDGGEVQFLAVPDKEFKDISFSSNASAYSIKPKKRKAFMVGGVETVFISLASYAGISIDKGNGSHDTVLDGVIMLFSPLIFPFYISYTFLVKGELDT